MRLLEYEAKAILHHAGVPVPIGHVIDDTPATTETVFPAVLKSQVPIGGRGKNGGILFVEDADELAASTTKLLRHDIRGYTPKKLLVEERLSIKDEFYLSLLIDREHGGIKILAHQQGGVEVESNDSGFITLPIDRDNIPAKQLAIAYGMRSHQAELKQLLTNLYRAFITNDATLIEINPLVLTAQSQLVCSDAKIELDDAADFRHEWHYEARPSETNFVTLNPNGNVATIANGAGLAMATVDAAVDKGLTPANFLDIGGGATTDSIVGAFERIIAYPHVEAIIINIFAGITKCDEVAKAIVEARTRFNELPSLHIRLAGTNFEAAAEILHSHDIAMNDSLDDCLASAQQKVTKHA